MCVWLLGVWYIWVGKKFNQKREWNNGILVKRKYNRRIAQRRQTESARKGRGNFLRPVVKSGSGWTRGPPSRGWASCTAYNRSRRRRVNFDKNERSWWAEEGEVEFLIPMEEKKSAEDEGPFDSFCRLVLKSRTVSLSLSVDENTANLFENQGNGSGVEARVCKI